MKKYSFRKNSPYKDQDANVVGSFLEDLFPDQNPNPEIMIDYAKDPKCPLHRFFDWDDRSAARKYRREQATSLISALYIELDDGTPIRAYESVFVKEIDERAYISNELISENKELWKQVVDAALSELLYWKSKYHLYKDHFPEIWNAIEALRSKANEKERSKTTSRNKGRNPTNRSKDS